MTAQERHQRWFLAAAAMFFAGVVIGTRVDDAPERTPTWRAGWRVLEADFHTHTRMSDGLLGPFDLVVQARRRGLDVLAITEHNNVFPAKMGRAFSRVTSGPTVLLGEEVTTNRFHLIAIGIRERIAAGPPLGDTIDAIHRQGGVAIAAHPVKRYWARFDAVMDKLDGAEVMHPLAYGTGRGGWSWDDMRDFYLRARKAGHPLTAVGSSDYHFGSPLGVTRTLVFAKQNDEYEVMDALRHGRTVVFDLEGRAYGDPELIRALEAEPYTPRAPDYGYRGNGFMDRAGRLLGLVGLLCMVLFGRPRTRW
jgi:predicted metal-dependent phosphoesterase TrpH